GRSSTCTWSRRRRRSVIRTRSWRWPASMPRSSASPAAHWRSTSGPTSATPCVRRAAASPTRTPAAERARWDAPCRLNAYDQCPPPPAWPVRDRSPRADSTSPARSARAAGAATQRRAARLAAAAPPRRDPVRRRHRPGHGCRGPCGRACAEHGLAPATHRDRAGGGGGDAAGRRAVRHVPPPPHRLEAGQRRLCHPPRRPVVVGNPGAGIARAAPGPGTRPAGAAPGPGHPGGAHRRHPHGRGETAAAGAGRRRAPARAPGPPGRNRRRPVREANADAAPEQRLHPWSWLFVLLQQLRQFLVPLVVLLFAGRRDAGPWEYAEYAPLAGVAALVVVSVLQYFTYRYRIGADGISIRSGLLQRNLREIPFSRIHNVG